MTPLRERIEGLTRLACHEFFGMEPEDNGDYLKRSDVLAALDEPWTSERPTEGKWWLSRHPSRRDRLSIPVLAVEVNWSRLFVDGQLYAQINDQRFDGAKWQRRTTPQDPFADKSEDKDR